jgi:hypothetical protein
VRLTVDHLAIKPRDIELQPLFTEDGVVGQDWLVRDWEDVSKHPARKAQWEVRDGILIGTGGLPDDVWVGTWLSSEEQYEDFIIDFEFHLGKDWGNGGLALRCPSSGNPAMDGMELQLTEPHYQYEFFPDANATQLTGGIYLAIAPIKQSYKPNEWNHLRVELVGTSLRAWLNDELIHNADLDTLKSPVRDDESGRDLLPIVNRPRKGHIGFQDLSGEGGKVKIRKAKFAEIK